MKRGQHGHNVRRAPEWGVTGVSPPACSWSATHYLQFSRSITTTLAALPADRNAVSLTTRAHYIVVNGFTPDFKQFMT